MVKHFADLGWEKRKILTLADLKREIERLGDINERILPVQIIIKTINSFEASVKEQITELENRKSKATIYKDAFYLAIEELCRILGGERGAANG